MAAFTSSVVAADVQEEDSITMCHCLQLSYLSALCKWESRAFSSTLFWFLFVQFALCMCAHLTITTAVAIKKRVRNGVKDDECAWIVEMWNFNLNLYPPKTLFHNQLRFEQWNFYWTAICTRFFFLCEFTTRTTTAQSSSVLKRISIVMLRESFNEIWKRKIKKIHW